MPFQKQSLSLDSVEGLRACESTIKEGSLTIGFFFPLRITKYRGLEINPTSAYLAWNLVGAEGLCQGFRQTTRLMT